MTEISFTSAIRPVSTETFNKIASKIGAQNSVNYPWTKAQSVKSAAAYTTGVCDCTFVGISDGQEVLAMHLCPGFSENFNNIKSFIANSIDVKNPNLQGILIGSQITNPSQLLYSKLKEALEYFKIPYSELKRSNSPVHVAYSSIKDEWTVTSDCINNFLKSGRCTPKTILKCSFDKVNISELDEIV